MVKDVKKWMQGFMRQFMSLHYHNGVKGYARVMQLTVFDGNLLDVLMNIISNG